MGILCEYFANILRILGEIAASVYFQFIFFVIIKRRI